MDLDCVPAGLEIKMLNRSKAARGASKEFATRIGFAVPVEDQCIRHYSGEW
jgi:hypothetical protein